MEIRITHALPEDGPRSMQARRHGNASVGEEARPRFMR